MKLCAALLMLLVGCSTPPMQHGIPNFAVVEPGVYRGGQPTAEGWHYLRSIGVENDIKLNFERRAEEYQLGPNYIFEEPMTLCEQVGLAELPQPFRFGFKSNIGGTFIHCEHGQDRTGLFVAIWRVKFDGWSKADAEKEMLAHGFHKSLNGLWRYWQEFENPHDAPHTAQ